MREIVFFLFSFYLFIYLFIFVGGIYLFACEREGMATNLTTFRLARRGQFNAHILCSLEEQISAAYMDRNSALN